MATAKWKRDDFLKELETRLWEECGTIYKLGGIGRYDGAGGKRTYDCVGVFKSILWNYPFEPKNYNKTYPDVNVGGMKKRCTSTMPFDANKMKPGMLVFIGTEHIGMVGDPKFFKKDTDPVNIIYESTPAFLNCFQRTSVAERASRQWDTMGYADFIDYSEEAEPETPVEPSEDTELSKVVEDLQKEVENLTSENKTLKSENDSLKKELKDATDKLSQIENILDE